MQSRNALITCPQTRHEPLLRHSFASNNLEMDRISSKARSKNMSRIRSKSALDAMLHGYLKAYHIQHHMHPRQDGSPDAIVLPNLLIFVDGCFWHSCPKCGTTPKSRQEYWIPKLERTRVRDRKYTRKLRRQGWRVLRVWEHAFLAEPQTFMREVLAGRKRL
jgi:DNA mismatch endonuclease (patch repair protein)